MIEQHELDLAIRESLERMRTELGGGSVEANSQGGYCLRRRLSSLCMLGALGNNEIEWWMDSPQWETGHIGSDVIQEWLGDPEKAFQFNESNFLAVVQRVLDIGKAAIFEYEANAPAALVGLLAAETRNVRRSKLTRLRSEAKHAWEKGNYRALENIFAQMPSELSAVEAKRLQIARRKLGQMY